MIAENRGPLAVALLALVALPAIAAAQGAADTAEAVGGAIEEAQPQGRGEQREAAAREREAEERQREARDEQEAREARVLQQERERTAVERQRELERLQVELDRARREMEAAAREISRITSTGPRPVLVGRRGAFFGPAYAAIGANVENAESGALIVGVTPGGPADEAGLLSGDVIVEIAGNPTLEEDRRPVEIVVSTLADMEPGAVVEVAVIRAGESLTFDVVSGESSRFGRFFSHLPGRGNWVVGDLSDMPDLPDLPDMPEVDMTVFRDFARDVSSQIDLSAFFASRWRDMELVSLTESLGSYFGTDTGILVIRAPENDDLDIVDGDVLLTISGRTPTSPEHAMRILSSFVPGERLELEIMRRQRRRTVEYTIPDPDEVDAEVGSNE